MLKGFKDFLLRGNVVELYFAIVLPLKTIQQRRARGEEAGPAESTDIELLKEIRDLLRGQAVETGRPAAGTGPADPDPEPNRLGVAAAPEQTVPFGRPPASSDQSAPPAGR